MVDTARTVIARRSPAVVEPVKTVVVEVAAAPSQSTIAIPSPKITNEAELDPALLNTISKWSVVKTTKEKVLLVAISPRV